MVRRARPPACSTRGAAIADTCSGAAQRTRADGQHGGQGRSSLHNTPGVAVIEIGAREFMCEGEVAPFDHPHVYLDMGDATEIICPYCSTLFRHDPTLDPHAARTARVRAGGYG